MKAKSGARKSIVELKKINDLMMDCVVYYSSETKNAAAVPEKTVELVKLSETKMHYNPILPKQAMAKILPKPAGQNTPSPAILNDPAMRGS